MELFEKIRREYFDGVGTILGVAKKLGVHRRMVREAIQNAAPPPRKKTQRNSLRLLGEVVLFIHQVLAQDRQAPPKQRHTAQRIWERLRDELPHHPVSPRSVRREVEIWRQQHDAVRTETYIGQQYEPGIEAQADWYEAWAELGGERVKLQVFCLRSMYSGAAFHRAYWRATQVAFLDAHIQAFAWFGGVFRTQRYDNLKLQSSRLCAASDERKQAVSSRFARIICSKPRSVIRRGAMRRAVWSRRSEDFGDGGGRQCHAVRIWTGSTRCSWNAVAKTGSATSTAEQRVWPRGSPWSKNSYEASPAKPSS